MTASRAFSGLARRLLISMAGNSPVFTAAWGHGRSSACGAELGGLAAR